MLSFYLNKSALLSLVIFFTICENMFNSAYAQSTVTENGEQQSPSKELDLKGFRSAHFNMDEKEVRAAIIKDFKLKNSDVVEGLNTVQRTRSLTVVVPELLPEGGAAQVSYVFGYKSKNLIQVGVTWNATIDTKITQETLSANGDVLQGYFLGAGYKSDTISTGAVLANGILLFRGSDQNERTTILLLQGNYKDGENKRKILTPDNLTLLYSLNAEKPDIFQVKKDNF